MLDGDNPWLRTLWQMTLGPGRVAREYVAGKRSDYVHPLKYAFYLVLIATVLTSSGGGFSPNFSPLIAPWRLLLLENIPLFMLVVSPIAALSLRLLFWKPFNFVEIWVFVLYLLGQLSLVYVAIEALDFLVRYIAVASEPVRAVIGVSSLLLILAYYSWGVRGFFRGRLDWSLIGALISIVATTWVGAQVYVWLADG